MMLSHWPCFTWKFFMIWFHKILKLTLKAAIMSKKHIYWALKKTTNLTASLEIYLCIKSKNNNSVKHV